MFLLTSQRIPKLKSNLSQRITDSSSSTTNLNYSSVQESPALSKKFITKSSASSSAIVDDETLTVSATSFLVKKFGENGKGIGKFSNPQDVCFYDNETLIVSDSINQSVQLFDILSGNVKSILFDKKKPIRDLRRPIGLSITPQKHILVADYDQRCIGELHSDSRFIRKFGEQHLVGPKGVTCSISDMIAVVDNKANSICLFHSDGKFSHRFGSPGAQKHQIAGPHYAAFDSKNNNIIVSYFHNSSIKIFDIASGQLLFTFGSNGNRHGEFQGPTGLTVDNEKDMIFVSDWGNNRVQVFDKNGLFIRILQPKDEPLYGPQGLDFNSSSQMLAVADSGTHTAKLFSVKDLLATETSE
ncbi:unnamed protein product [Didymodactylos carnosus]|uniref:Uncharacterized protein n=1 Tax=Didymodactylos carnosus TaxID=1234261 RepID=A0A814CHY8_9BILA|nr:unnamed protein product [Didymodactylos carnosus]CAF3719069.1 unnamed protein product [Didymodactylos carnosus]